jgi:iron complex transport system substrate-binding protein
MTDPQRIVSLLSSATEILFALGAKERVVGVGHECDHPAEVQGLPRLTSSAVDSQNKSAVIDQQVVDLAQSGSALYRVDREQLIELAPDLIVTQSQCDVCAVRYQDVLDMVEQTPELTGTSVVALNPTSLDEVFEDIARVGASIGNHRQADEVVSSLKSRVESVASRATQASESKVPRVACIEWIEPLMLAANWMPELVRLAGGGNAIPGGGHSSYSQWQTVLDFDPEVLVVMPCGFDLERTLGEGAQLDSWEHWGSITAVQQGRVYAVDGNAYFNRSGPRLVDSLELLAHLIHPTRFPASGLSAALRQAYRRL